MSLCNRLIGGAVEGIALVADVLFSFWQTPREVEWAKAAADGLAEREAEEEVAEPSTTYSIEDVYRLRNEQYIPCTHCGQTRRAHEEPYTGACQAFTTHETPAVTPHTAASGPAEGDAPRPPSAVVDMCCCDFGGVIVTQICGPCRCNDHGDCDHPMVNPPAPEFDWVTTAIPVIAGVLAGHHPIGPRWNGDGPVPCADVSGRVHAEFYDRQDWRAHLSPIIAASLQTVCPSTISDEAALAINALRIASFGGQDRPRPLADFPKHQK